MSMTDPIADMLTRIRNACGSKHRRVDMPASKVKTEIARILEEPPIVETMLDLLQRVEPEFQERVRKHIILAGGGGLIRNLSAILEKALERVGGGKVSVTEAPVFTGADGGLALARDAQDSDWDRLVN